MATSTPVTITVLDSIFEKNIYVNPVASVMNIFTGVLLFRVKASKETTSGNSSVDLDIRGMYV